MDSATPTIQLLKNPLAATIIQVATLIRQAIGADRVEVFEALDPSAGSLQPFWSDTVNADDEKANSLLEEGPDLAPILNRLSTVNQIFTTNTSLPGGQFVRYLQAEFSWKPDDIHEEGVQAIYWQLSVSKKAWVFLWGRHGMGRFTREDRQRFETLRVAIHQCIATDYLDPNWRYKQRVASSVEPANQEDSARLSPAQREVFTMLIKGMTEKEIANTLDRSPNTVHTHVRAIYHKFAVHSRSELKEVFKAEV